MVQTSVTISILPRVHAQSLQSHLRTLDFVPSPHVTEHGVSSRYVQTAGLVDVCDSVDNDVVVAVVVVVG